MRRRATTVTILTSLLLLVALPALACGFLIAENGAVRLVRTSTLVAWEYGVEHYMTSFEFQGATASFGSIIPLPGEPTVVEKGGSWTLQRLGRETQPSALETQAESADGGRQVEVLQEVAIDALDITILRGGGSEVAAWADANGFALGDPTAADEMLSFYADRSPYFMAARFDVERAGEFAQAPGDGTPIHLAIPTDDPWVPLRILGYAKAATDVVDADVYLLTPQQPTLLPRGRDGVTVEADRRASAALLDDLRSDENSDWIPQEAWLTYLRLAIPAGDLDFDLAIDVNGGVPDAVAAFGTAATLADPMPPFAVEPSAGGWSGQERRAVMLTALVGLLVVAVSALWSRRSA